MRFPLKVFVVFCAIYLLTWGGHYTTGDGSYKIAWARVMLYGSPERMQPGANGVCSKYGIGHSLIAMAPLAAAAFIQKHTGIRCEAALYTVVFVANGALLLALLAYYLCQMYSGRRAWLTVGIIGLATTWWPYTKLDFSEVFVTTILFAGFLLMRSGFTVAGMLVAAFTLTIRTDSLILLGLLAAWYLVQRPGVRTALKLGLPVVPSVLVVMAANYARYHSVFDHGYAQERFSTPLLLGLYGILFSGGKSIFLFSPPLILGFLGWTRFRRRIATRLDAFFFLAVFVSELLLYSKWWDWSSDDAWGVRFLVPGIVFMCIPLIEVLDRRSLVIAIAGIGVAVQLLAVTVGGLDYLLLMRASNSHRQNLFAPPTNSVDLEDIRFNPRYSQIAGNWILLRHLLHIPPAPCPPDLVKTNGTPLYDTLPPNVWAAAHWDFIWARHVK